MVKALKALPSIAIVEVGLPKIYGFEVCKRLKLRAETKSMKFILVNSVHDKTRYKREPESFYGADDYIEEHLISTLLIESIDALTRKEPVEKKEEVSEKPSQPLSKDKLAQKEEPLPQPEGKKSQPSADEKIERAKRLARTIVSDIYLYNTAKADEAIRNNTFQPVFAPDLKEGLKLYEGRIAREVRAQGDFFQEALINFIEGKKKTI
jgi:response regulator RpfG family c-di-GMP phosphodiesterase